MKKLLVILLCSLMLCGCKKENDPDQSGTLVIDEGDEPALLVGGWYTNPDLPTLNDAYFDAADTNHIYTPVLLLGSQVVNGTNYAYLAYKEPISTSAFSAYVVVVVYVDLDGNAEILSESDFVLEDYLQTNGGYVSEGYDGAFVENQELKPMLDNDINEVFTKVFEEWPEGEFFGVSLLATQVVAGTNYAILAVGTGINNDPNPHLYIVSIYESLDGTVELNNLCSLDLNMMIN